MSENRWFIDIGDICNARCYFCSNNSSIFPAKPVEAIKKEIDTYLEKWVNEINFWTGEFTIHPGFFEILEYGKTLGIKAYIHTNGLRLSEESFVEKLRNTYGITTINVSLHGINAQIADMISWVSWGFRKTIRWLQNCAKHWIQVALSFVITRDNVNQVLWIYLLSRKLKIRTLKYWLLNGWQEYQENLIPSPLSIAQELSKVVTLHKKLGDNSLNIKFLNIPQCFLGWEMETFMTESAIWNENHQLALCTNCKRNKDCPGVPSYYSEQNLEGLLVPIVTI